MRKSMWAINDMFGTGTRGFAIITTVITTCTYAVVFWLLHPSAFKDASQALRKLFERKEDLAGKDKSDSVKRPSTLISGKTKGKEKERGVITDEEQLGRQISGSDEALKRSLISRLRGKKARNKETKTPLRNSRGGTNSYDSTVSIKLIKVMHSRIKEFQTLPPAAISR